MPTSADDTMEVPTKVIPNNFGNRNLFCYFITIRPHLGLANNQKTKMWLILRFKPRKFENVRFFLIWPDQRRNRFQVPLRQPRFKCVLLYIIKPIFGNYYGPGASSRASQGRHTYNCESPTSLLTSPLTWGFFFFGLKSTS